MRLRYALLTVATLTVAVLAGWGAGAAGDTCEQSCPAQGPCPAPADCGKAFNWAGAITVGGLIAAVLVVVAVAAIARSNDE